ncbi:MAG: hypothetical protein ACLQVL_12460 [Terriglobia bacterium]
MKCLETEKLIGYAYRLIDEAAESEVRAHLGECCRCRKIVEQHARLGVVLDEWKPIQPTPEFDPRVRQAVDARQSSRSAWGGWGLGWSRGLALALLGVLVIAGVVWSTRIHRPVSDSSKVAARQPQTTSGARAPAQVASVHHPAVAGRAGVRPAQAAPDYQSAVAASTDDKDAQALEDYDLAANFDVLSELRKGESRVAN